MTAEQLHAWRTERGLTVTQLAQLLEVPDATVWRWEHGKMAIRHPRILELALSALTLPAASSSRRPSQ